MAVACLLWCCTGRVALPMLLLSSFFPYHGITLLPVTMQNFYPESKVIEF
jgi:hypothetical protein